MKLVKKEEVLNSEISKGFETIPNPETKRFVIKIPKIDDKFLDDTSHIVDWEGKPTGINKGLIFHNGTDAADQLVEANGNGIMIINNVSDVQSKKLLEMTKLLDSISGENYINSFKTLVKKMDSIGFVDKYNSTIDYMNKNLRKSPDSDTYVRTNDAMVAHVSMEDMIIEGAGGTSLSIQDPNQTDMKYNVVGHQVNKGDVILETEDGFRKVDRKVFEETYLNTDGNKFKPEDLDSLDKIGSISEVSKPTILKLIHIDEKNPTRKREFSFEINSEKDLNNILDLAIKNKIPENKLISLIQNGDSELGIDKAKITSYKIVGVDHAVDIIGVVFDDDIIEIPLIERLFEPLGLALPGGFIDIGESYKDAAKREFKEELGANIDSDFFSNTKLYHSKDENGELYDARGEITTQAFVADVSRNNNFTAGDDAKSFSMFKVDLKDLNREEMISKLTQEVDSLNFSMDRHSLLIIDSIPDIIDKHLEIKNLENCIKGP